jgi:lipoate-protein ligase A
MILWCDGAHDPAENMRRDAALLAAAESGAEPVLRLFDFRPPGITLGMNQDPERELDLERCASHGVPWAVRPTGGRAIFHQQDWNYALAAPLDDHDWGGRLGDVYARASVLIVRSLIRLGVPAALVPRAVAETAAKPWEVAGPVAPCFASTARHEVVLAGRKLVGSAQRRTAQALLQEGSVLLGPSHLRVADYLALPEPARERMRGALARATAPAEAWLGPAAPLARWADALASELGPRLTRLNGASGAFLLTASGSGSYTPPFS